MTNLSDDDFKSFLGVPQEYVEQQVDELTEEEGRKRKGNRQLVVLQRILLFLVWLRYYPTDRMLALMFDIPKTTLRAVRREMLDWFFRRADEKIRNEAKRILPHVLWFGTKVVAIIDGSEQPTKTPSRCATEQAFFSTKKKQHSVTKLVVCDLEGKILYVSPSQSGGQNDIVLAKLYQSEWVKLFKQGDIILGDEGFEGFATARHEPQIIAINKANANFRSFSSQRIKIENVFSKIKRWRACAEELRSVCSEELLVQHHKAWVVVSSFVNQFVN